MKISASLIVRDDESTLEACLESIRKHVDEIVVVDTGSTDKSPEIAKKYADKWELYVGCNNPDTGLIDDFADARQRSQELCTGDALFWCDGDDVVKGAENLRELANRRVDNLIVLIPYEYSYDEHGNVTCLHWRERLVFPRHKFRWQSPVHEVLCPDGPVVGSTDTVMSSDVVIQHRQLSSTKPREPQRNLRILEAYIERVGESDPRAMFYLGLEYRRIGNFGDAWRVWRRYVQLSGWAEERCLAWLGMAQCHQHLGDHELAIECAQKALLEKSWPEPCYVIGKSLYAWARRKVQGDPLYNYSRSIFWIQLGLSLEDRGERLLFSNPKVKYEVQEELNYALSATGDVEGAIQSCEMGLSGMPGHTMLSNNLENLKAQLARMRISREVGNAGLPERARQQITQALNEDFQVGSPEAAIPPLLTEQAPPSDGRLDLVFFTGPAWEHWTPDKLAEGGMGGSETMAWELARRLQKMGHRVRIYAHCLPTGEGIYEGVAFLDSSRFVNVACDVAIISRMPAAVDAPGLKAKAKVLWVHDVHCGDELTLERDRKFDQIWALSEWHKKALTQAYPLANPRKFVVIRNGIDLSRFGVQVERDPHRAIYSSSPDRGLLTALEIWPEVRKEVPGAELHVFYGFHNWEKLIEQRGSKDDRTNVAHLKHLIETTDGVIFHGRVNQKELARAMLGAGVWAYPTWFTETSCITAMEAQAAGLFAVTSPIAALNETAKDWAVFIEGDWRSEEYKKAFTEAVVDAMRLREHAEPEVDAERFSLDTLAEDWSESLYALCSHLEKSVVPKFVDVEVQYASS